MITATTTTSPNVFSTFRSIVSFPFDSLAIGSMPLCFIHVWITSWCAATCLWFPYNFHSPIILVRRANVYRSKSIQFHRKWNRYQATNHFGAQPAYIHNLTLHWNSNLFISFIGMVFLLFRSVCCVGCLHVIFVFCLRRKIKHINE